MHPVHDIDTLLLLATALASKRRPAEALEIVAAIDLIQGNIPSEQKLSEAFARLGEHGLLLEAGGGYALTAAAQAMVETLPHKAEPAERLFRLRDELSAYNSRGDQPAIAIAPEQLHAAIVAHRTAAASPVKNLLVPKPKPEDGSLQRPGQRQRKPPPTRRRKN